MNHEQRLDIAAAKLAIRQPFIATIFSGLRREISDTVPTAAVKGMHLRFNPLFMDVLDDEELLFVAAHEAMHPALLHSYRVGDRQPGLWNTAADATINPQLIESGLKMPVWDDKKFAMFPEAKAEGKKRGDPFGVLIDWVKGDMDSEVVYQKLIEEQEKKEKDKPEDGSGDGSGDGDPKGGWGNSGDLEAADGAGGEGDAQSEAEVRVLVSQAARTAFASGDKSALIQRILGVCSQSDTDWKDETRSMMTESSRNDYSYRRFSRRFLYTGVYLPSLWSESLGTLGVGIDTSGSMTESQLAAIEKNLRIIIEDCAPDRVIVVYCDAEINKTVVFEKGEELVLEMCGGGGTDMRKITDYFSGVEERLAGVIVFTDLYTPFPTVEPDYTLLWGAVNADRSTKPPVGRRVEVKV